MKLKCAESIVSVAIGMILIVYVSFPSLKKYLSVMLTFNRTSNASSDRFFAQSQRGLSGTNHMPINWIAGIAACMPTGILHDASDVYLIVPNTVHAAINAPTYHRVLYMVVNFPRCWGWASSVIRSGADSWLTLDLLESVGVACSFGKGFHLAYPRPTKNRPARNMPELTDGTTWMIVPMKITTRPMITPIFRPKKSAT